MAKILIGFMGAGKTTIAQSLDPNYVDMDAIITERIGMPIADFFAKEGEAAFRKIESEVLEELLKTNQVVSTGGGVVESEHNRRLLAANADTIYLKIDLETVRQRIQADTKNIRPLFVNNTKEAFQALFDRRQALYEEAASRVILVSGKTPAEIVEEIG